MILGNVSLILPDRIADGRFVRIGDGVIKEISEQPLQPESGEEFVDFRGCYLSPGFIDLHVHGALRRDTMEADAEAFETICNFHAAGGTTALALTTVTTELDELLKVLNAVAEFRKTHPQALGVHVEGPYFSREKAGAHRLELIHDPRHEEYEEILRYSHVITQMTLAPELPGALELIAALRSGGIRASGGHSDAWGEEARRAVEQGMNQVTHTFNCMSSSRRRGPYREAGLLEVALSEPAILCELIADGRHVSPTLMRMLYRAKGVDGICLVTDATSGAGLGDGSSFRLGNLECVVHDDVGFTADRQCLAGSTASMIRLVQNMVQLVGLPLVEAVRMASLVPARALGLEQRKGQISEGADADIVVLDDRLEVCATFISGKQAHAKPRSS